VLAAGPDVGLLAAAVRTAGAEFPQVAGA
jgi:hypothetical protein